MTLFGRVSVEVTQVRTKMLVWRGPESNDQETEEETDARTRRPCEEETAAGGPWPPAQEHLQPRKLEEAGQRCPRFDSRLCPPKPRGYASGL